MHLRPATAAQQAPALVDLELHRRHGATLQFGFYSVMARLDAEIDFERVERAFL